MVRNTMTDIVVSGRVEDILLFLVVIILGLEWSRTIANMTITVSFIDACLNEMR